MRIDAYYYNIIAKINSKVLQILNAALTMRSFIQLTYISQIYFFFF